MLTYVKENKLLCVLALLFLIIRLPFLGQMYLLHDERDIVMSGYSIAKTARDLYGNVLPINFTGINPDNPLFAIYFSALGWLFMPWRSVFTARLPFVLVSTVLIFLVYELVYEMTKNKKLAVLTSIIFCFSPWVFHLTRLAMDVTVAIVYIFAAMLLYLRNKRLLAYIFFFLTFYTYQGFRVLIPFLLVYLEIFNLISSRPRLNRKSTNVSLFVRNNIINLVFFLFLLSSVLFIDAKVTANRFDQLIFSNNESLVQEVNFKRNTTIAHPLISRIFYNKITVSLDYVISTFIKGQDFFYLFKNGDYSAINGNASAGQFFLVFFVFYYAGLLALGKRFNRYDFYVAGFAMLGLLPAIVRAGSVTFSIRAMVSALGFSYILALGFTTFMQFIKKFSSPFRNVISTVLTLVFLINLTYFVYDYYFRRPISVGEQYNENERILVNDLMKIHQRKTVYHMYPYEPYMSYVFLNNTVNFSTVHEALQSKNNFVVDGYRFIPCVKYNELLTVQNSIVHERCLGENEYAEFSNMKKVDKSIQYQDYSKKTAYFFVE